MQFSRSWRIGLEPWVHIADGHELSSWDREDEISYNQQNRQEEKLKFYSNAFDFLTDNRIHGDYWEFGCHRARTFRMALTEARRHNLKDMRFVAFDSFEGLPEPESPQVVEIWKKGALKTSETDFIDMIKCHGVYPENVELVKGFYKDSLNGELATVFKDESRSPALVNIDCDFYESARDVFNFLVNFVKAGTLIYIDDFYSGFKGSPLEGVQKAFYEFENKLADTGYNLNPHMTIGWWGRSYIVY